MVAVVPANAGALLVPAGVNATVPLVPAGVKGAVPLVGTPAGQEIAPSTNVPPALLGTPTGQEIAPSTKAPPALLGTPAGHATVPAGVKLAVPLVPVAVTVWVWPAMAEPVNTWAVTVRFGAVALQAVVEPVPAAMLVAAQFPLVALAPLVPAGVPALLELVVAELPVKISAGTVPADPANVGTPAGQEIVG